MTSLGKSQYHRSDIEISRSLDKALQKNSPVQNKKVSIRSRLSDQGRQDPDSCRGPSQKENRGIGVIGSNRFES